MPKYINLQLFADEAVGGESSVGDAATETIAENPVSDGVATEGEGEQVAPAGEDQTPEETFEDLIKGKYKKDYEKALKSSLDKRFKKYSGLQAQIDAMNPAVQMMASRYNIAPNPDGSIPVDRLYQAMEADDTVLEKEAFDKGMSVTELKAVKRLERENALLRNAAMQEREQREYEDLHRQEEELKESYPDFNYEAEIENPQFRSLFDTMRRSGFPDALKAAYETVHREEILSGAMQYAVKRTEQKISNAIQAGARRPAENGTYQKSAAAVSSVDPSKLTKAQFEDIKRRAERGERIIF